MDAFGSHCVLPKGPQDRVTDHRIGLTLKNLRSVMEGDGLKKFIDALRKDHEGSLMEDVLEQL